MAKRFNVSIPDALAERLEPHKDKISLSAVMQAALERELAQLTLGNEEKQRRASFKAAAANAWMKRNGYLIKALGAFIDHLFEEAVNDQGSRFFDYYRHLYLACKQDELVSKISKDVRYYRFKSPGKEKASVLDMLKYAFEYEFLARFESDVCDFIKKKAHEGEFLIPSHLLYAEEDGETLVIDEDFDSILESNMSHKAALSMMDERLRSMLSDEEVDNFILDFESAFVNMENEEV